ncbi:MAG: response regulator [Pseudomonadota bacterium]
MTEKPIKRLLILDDNQIEQKLYRITAERSGVVDEILSFQYAEDVLDYLSAAEDLPVDCILLDINMPRMTGHQFLETAHERFGPGFARIVYVMLTTSVEPDVQRRAEAFPVVRRFIRKPLHKDDLKEIAAILISEAGPAL